MKSFYNIRDEIYNYLVKEFGDNVSISSQDGSDVGRWITFIIPLDCKRRSDDKVFEYYAYLTTYIEEYLNDEKYNLSFIINIITNNFINITTSGGEFNLDENVVFWRDLSNIEYIAKTLILHTIDVIHNTEI